MSKCPYCGSDDVHVGIGCDDKWGAFCNSCHADYNSRKATPSEAVDVFCNPAYLLNKTGLIRLAADDGKRPTLNTREFVVIRRKTAETMLSTIEDQFGTDEKRPETGETICDFCGYTDSESAWFDLCVALGKPGANEE